MSTSWLWVALLLLVSLLVLISFVDIKTYRIPDAGLFALSAIGLILSFNSAGPVDALISAAVYFLIFYSVRKIHFIVTGRIGLGFGDVKMAAVTGLWIPIAMMPVFLAISAFSALVFVLAMSRLKSFSVRETRMPFAPFLALALLVCWILTISKSNIGYWHATEIFT